MAFLYLITHTDSEYVSYICGAELTMGHGSWIKWVNKFGWVTWVTGQWPVDPFYIVLIRYPT